ncbi:MAG TPA: 4-hydroxy-tetrahydrodipicolinate reductase [Planctomycetota bacterium]|nr:4-hydroxy-tetrahydrodipicolinate reductase [Planctomycetota bacterium]
MPINVCINGAAGRMGQRLIALCLEDPELKLAYTMEHSGHAWIGKDVGPLSGLGKNLDVPVARSLCPNCGVQVIIDFTIHSAATEHAEEAAEQGIPIVIGTTGMTEDEKKRIAKVAEKVAVIHAPNFSVGVNVLFKAAEMVARTLGDSYDVEITEAHHNQKLDAPSGTAIGLAESIARGLNRNLKEVAVYGRQGMTGKRTQKEIGIHALRMGDVVGEHTAYFAIGGERLELTHKASSRDTFARGALRAAKWLVQNKKGPGMYTMAQVLGL